MNVLIVEDNEIKLDKLTKFLKENFSSISTSIQKSYSAAVNDLRSNTYELVILDMSLPTYDKKGLENGGQTRTFGGREIASQMKRRGMKTPFIIVTQFDGFAYGDKFVKIPDLEDELNRDYPDCFMGIIYFDAISNSWREELSEVVSSFLE